MFNTYTGKWLTDDLFRSGFCFNSSTTNAHEFMYKVPQATDISVYRDYINSLPYVDQPGVFGLHVNADLTFRLQESASMLETIQVNLEHCSLIIFAKCRFLDSSIRVCSDYEMCTEFGRKLSQNHHQGARESHRKTQSARNASKC